MAEELTKELSPSAQLVLEGNDLSKRIVAANTPQELEDMTNMFKMNMAKKNMVRANKLSSLMELVDDEVFTRFACTPEGFDNTELLKYMDSTQRALTSLQSSIEQAPTIQINNIDNSVNVNNNLSGLNKDSRVKVLSAVNDILNSLQSDDIGDIIEVDNIEEVDD